MKRRDVHRWVRRSGVVSYFVAVLIQPVMTHASSAQSDSVLHCVLLNEEDWPRGDVEAAGKRASELNVGEPRTVRMIYFLPNDRPYRQSVADTMKAWMVRMQRLFGEQMEAHGYGYMTFRYEADAEGAPVVHRMDGEHTRGYYYASTFNRMRPEVNEAFDRNHVVRFFVIDHGYRPAIGTSAGGKAAGTAAGHKDRGSAYLPAGFRFGTGVHELAHAFGLMWHDNRDDDYFLSPVGGGQLSACSAAHLSVSPFFNPEVPLEREWRSLPSIDLLSPRSYYVVGTKALVVHVRIAAPHGLNHVTALVPELGAFSVEVLGCRMLSGEEEAEIEYEYDGVIPSTRTSRGHSTLSEPPVHSVWFSAMDRRGNQHAERFRFAQRSPYHLATLEGHSQLARSVAVSPDGSLLASGSFDKTVRLWDTTTLEAIATLDMSGPDRQVSSLAFSLDGSLLAVGETGGGITLWDVASRQMTGTLEGHTGRVQTLAFSASGDTLVSGASYDEDRIKVWDVASRQLIGVLKGHTSHVRQVAFSPDGRVLASCSQDRTIRVWDLSAMKERYRLVRIGGGRIGTMAFSPDGRILAADSTEEGVIALWDWAARRNIADVPIAHERGITYLTFSPDGESLATAGGGWVIVRDAATGKRGERFKVRARFPHIATPWTMAFWRGGSVLAVGTTNGKVELWDMSEWVRRRPERVEVVSGLGQRGVAGASLPAPFEVSVRDENGDPFPGIPVIFDVTGGGGALSRTAARADTAGNAATTLTLGPESGVQTVVARAAGLAPAVFTATAYGSPDLNADGQVDFSDFVLLAGKFGLSEDDEAYDPRIDLDGDGAIGFSDFLILAGAFGQSA